MSFGSSGFGGFGSNNQQQQNTGFGGFGANTNTTNTNTNTTGFGSSANSGFGSNNTNAANAGNSLFGGGATTTNSGFGSSGGFGATNSAFGSRPAFGSTTPNPTSSGALFGSNTSASGSGFGGFGSTQQNTTPGFGTSNTGSGLFGQNNQTSGFGAANSGGSLFGGGNANANANQNANATATNSGFGGSAGSNTGFGGFGGASVSNQNQGTGGTPFTEHGEKDQTTTGPTTNKFQSITCLPQYVNFSFEELRLVDYNQGRRMGNQSGQAGAFGTNTGFGGFGQSNTSGGFGSSTSGGLFGQPAASTSTGFGAPASGSGFGTTGGTSLFGQNKPAAGGLFGTTTASSGTSAPSLFGNQASSTAGFGQNNNAFGSSTSGTGTGLFGNQQQKPSSFGQPSNTAASTGFGNTTGSGFGQQPASGGLFGNNQSSGFGQQQNTQNNSSFGGFGQTQNQNQTQNQAGGLLGGGFGQTQNKPAFGAQNTTTGTNLFGQQPQQPQSTSLFGTANQQPQQGGGIFGNKPATGSLFGNNQNTATTPSLFGNLNNNQTAQNQTPSLFGNNQQKPSLFGNNATANNSGSLFGGLGQNQSQQAGGSLFGGTQNPQQQPGSSLFGGSLQQNQQQPQQQQQAGLTSSIMSNNPYGNDTLFANLTSSPQSPGPLATPLTSSQKPRKPAPLPTYRLSPAASSRLITPQKTTGYGFEYSTYGTPGSAFSNASPLLGGSLSQSGRFGSTLGRSLSTSNIRNSSSPTDSILNPNAFSSSGGTRGSSSLKKLRINRNIRIDLFGTETGSDPQRSSPLKKSVSFGTDANEENRQQSVEGVPSNPETSQALVHVDNSESPEPTAEEQGLLRSSRSLGKDSRTNGNIFRQEMEQGKNKELAVVPENDQTNSVPPKPSVSPAENARLSQEDQEPGEYYIVPSRVELEKMSRKQLSSVKPFMVGRRGVGKIEWSEVDLSEVNLDDICGKIVQLGTRSATVYTDKTINTPPPGKALNMPAMVTLGNSWPRYKGGFLPVYERKGPRFDKHILRLKRVPNTQFVDYKVDTGEWVFRVNHFSTYKLDFDDEDLQPSMSSPLSSTSMARREDSKTNGLLLSGGSVEELSSPQSSNVDDTFEFRRSRGPPGTYDSDVAMENEEDSDTELNFPDQDHTNYLQPNLVQSGDHDNMQVSEAKEPVQSDDGADYGSLGKQHDSFGTPFKPKSIMKTSQHHLPALGTSTKAHLNIGADWAAQLQHSISPKKQNREMLREFQSKASATNGEEKQVKFGLSLFAKDSAPFATSIDVMNSLFGDRVVGSGKKQGAAAKGFKYPYAKRSKTDQDMINMNDLDKAFYTSFKPSWTADGQLVYAGAPDAPQISSGVLVEVQAPMELDDKDVHFARFAAASDKVASQAIKKQREISRVNIEDGVPQAHTTPDFKFADFAYLTEAEHSTTKLQTATYHEVLMWQLASILFDTFDPLETLDAADVRRKQTFSSFWRDLVLPAANAQAETATDKEEKAIYHLTANDIWAATESLHTGKDFRVSTLIAQIGSSEALRKDITEQINAWRESDVLSEISPTLRTLYELLAGNTCISDGKGGVGRENKAATFNISTRYGLNWKQSFGLRLWYGITHEESLLAAIHMYWEDVESSRVGVRPVPWFLEQNGNTDMEDESTKKAENILWGLMKTYAAGREAQMMEHRIGSSLKLGEVISPQNLTGNHIDARLSFQLYHLFRAQHIADFDEFDRAHKADMLASDFAFQLSSSSTNLCDAVFASLHLSNARARQAAIEQLLNRHAGIIGDDGDTCDVFRALEHELLIPTGWIYAAKALHAKSVLHNYREQVYCLLRAGQFDEAHQVLTTVVGPRAIIEDDLTGLHNVLEKFIAAGATSVTGWETGGEVYTDYVRLMLKKSSNSQEEYEQLLNRLTTALPVMTRPGLGLEQRVAVVEMGNRVAEVVGNDFAEMKPLLVEMAGDRVLQDAVTLSDAFYAQVAVATGGR